MVNKIVMQYYLDGPEVEIKIKPHGNSKSASTFFCTSESAKKLHKSWQPPICRKRLSSEHARW